MIRTWGDWQLFQELLATMESIAKKHKVRPSLLLGEVYLFIHGP